VHRTPLSGPTRSQFLVHGDAPREGCCLPPFSRLRVTVAALPPHSLSDARVGESRVGASITQKEGFKYLAGSAADVATQRASRFPRGARVIICDDFTQSGSTLLGAATMIRRHAEPNNTDACGSSGGGGGRGAAPLRVEAYVSHFVAKYDRATVAKFLASLYAADAPLDTFHCTDSIPVVVRWLRDDADARVAAGAPTRVRVMPLAPLVADWVKRHPLDARAARRGGGGGVGVVVRMAAE
jgi:hypothetical protein